MMKMNSLLTTAAVLTVFFYLHIYPEAGAQDNSPLNQLAKKSEYFNPAKTKISGDEANAILNRKEVQIEFKVTPLTRERDTMCAPTHDEEIIYGLGSDGKKHYFAVGTDVISTGIQIWLSEDLVSWKRGGVVFNRNIKAKFGQEGVPWNEYQFYEYTINDKGKYVFSGKSLGTLNRGRPFWAPCIYFHPEDETYYLYYCGSMFGKRNSFIGCAKSKTLDKGWEDCGHIIQTRAGDGKGYNAIDPVVIRDAEGKPWMAYGSFFGGIAILPLNPQDPSKLLHPGTHGKTICCRDGYEVITDPVHRAEAEAMMRKHEGTRFGNEGASLAYNQETGWYYLFVGYDNLEWSYHTRVGRSRKIDGPYLDFNGNPMVYFQQDLGDATVYGTKLAGAYQWADSEAGWAANGHSTLFKDSRNHLMFGSNSKWRGSGTSYAALRDVLWSSDGWPLLSPMTFAGEDTDQAAKVSISAITADKQSAEWDFIVFSVTHDRQGRRTDTAKRHTMNRDSKIISKEKDVDWQMWMTKQGINMSIALPDGTAAKGRVAYAWDYALKQQTVIFTGLTEKGIPVWGKRVSPPSFAK